MGNNEGEQGAGNNADKGDRQQAHRTAAYTHTDSLQLSAEFNSKRHLNLKSCIYETYPHMYV